MIEIKEPMDEEKKIYLDVIEKQLNVKENPIKSKTYTYEPIKNSEGDLCNK